MIEQPIEKTAENHGIRDVLNMEFVEAKKGRLLDEPIGELRDGVVGAIGSCPIPRFLQPAMHFLHEGVEMHAAFARHWRGVEKEIHHHGFAAPDGAMNIEPPYSG